MATRYYISLPDPDRARAAGAFAFRSQGAEALAEELQEALRSDALFQRWRATQEDPDAVDPALGATDPSASVRGEPHDLHVDLVVETSIPGAVFKQRMRLLAGSAWEMRDVRAA
ncbi:MAG TPA: hypothetical protein PK743_07480 [Luteimonas sp.]|nr:hypothetical protein [Luteimonas sp.]HRO27190.1 hypothetical protein [Luteimonas sp.]HRP72459.1 hypothetical protein [Luteimonas sp.]